MTVREVKSTIWRCVTGGNLMELRELLVVIPHSGLVVPHEVPLATLTERFPTLIRNVDWDTNWLYDFRDILSNQHLIFPYCSLVVEANRDPENLEASVPLVDVNEESVYKPNCAPSAALRRTLAHKYLTAFHQTIEHTITSGIELLLDGHSTIPARNVSDNQIELMNYQHSAVDREPRYFCPDRYIETYASELRKRLPEVNITVNSSDYYTVYGHVCAMHSVNAFGRQGDRVPAILQETSDSLYLNPDRTPNILALNRLRQAFAEALYATYCLIRNQ